MEYGGIGYLLIKKNNPESINIWTILEQKHHIIMMTALSRQLLSSRKWVGNSESKGSVWVKYNLGLIFVSNIFIVKFRLTLSMIKKIVYKVSGFFCRRIQCRSLVESEVHHQLDFFLLYIFTDRKLHKVNDVNLSLTFVKSS